MMEGIQNRTAKIQKQTAGTRVSHRTGDKGKRKDKNEISMSSDYQV